MRQRSFVKKLLYSISIWLFIVLGLHFFLDNRQIGKTFLKLEITDKVAEYVATPIPTRQNTPVLGIYNSVTLTPSPIEEKVASNSNTNSTTAPPKPTSAPRPVSIDKTQVYKLINDYRTSKGLSLVAIDSRLEKSSLNKANDMVAKNYFEHGNPWQFINGAGYSFNYAAENLAINYFSTNSLVTGWKNSPSHNQAMLDERNQHMGFSFVCQVNVSTYQDTCLAVIHFAREN